MIIAVDIVLVLCSAAVVLLLLVPLMQHKIMPKEAWPDYLLVVLVTVAVILKLLWFTPWL